MPHSSFPSHPVQAPPPPGLPQTKFELVGNDAALVHPSVRRLATTTVSPGAGTLQAAVNAASAGDTLVLADGTYTGSGTNVLEISKDITIRAQNSGQAVVDGQNARRVVHITSGTVALEGLKITKGSASVSSCPAWHVVAYDLSLRARLPSVPRPFPPSQTPPNTPPCPVPSPRWGACFSLTCFVIWQPGGGVYIYSGTVTLNSCDIHNNRASVRARHHKTTPSPRWGACFC